MLRQHRTIFVRYFLNKNNPKSAVLAGGGFIGLELAENLRELGIDVTIAQRQKQLMNPFDADMVALAIGVSPDTRLAKEEGPELGIKGSIVVNELMCWLPLSGQE